MSCAPWARAPGECNNIMHDCTPIMLSDCNNYYNYIFHINLYLEKITELAP